MIVVNSLVEAVRCHSDPLNLEIGHAIFLRLRQIAQSYCVLLEQAESPEYVNTESFPEPQGRHVVIASYG